MLAPEDVEDDDELKGSMGATAIAKANTNVFKRIMSPMQNANIILMLVNHLTQKIDRFCQCKILRIAGRV